ncbi:histone acetyltransferase of the MYST family protein, partial [Tanacetum coccineum]
MLFKLQDKWSWLLAYSRSDLALIINRRLDEWVRLEQLDLDSVENDVDEKVEDKVTGLKMTRHQKRKIDETHVEGHEELDPASLREHEEFTKVKNIATIELGR